MNLNSMDMMWLFLGLFAMFLFYKLAKKLQGNYKTGANDRKPPGGSNKLK